MNNDDIARFLKRMGMKDQRGNAWSQVIKPSSAYLILGRRGSGKTALGHFIVERFSQEYSLLPAIVGIPPEKRKLLPKNYVYPLSPADMPENSIGLIDEGAMLMPARKSMSSLNMLMISTLSLVRQRNQITVFVYHYPRMVDVGILAYLDGVFIKEPSVWDVYYGQKGDLLPKLTWKAAELFENMDENKRKSAVFVSAPQAKFEGILGNPLPSYWCDDVSKAWAGFQDQKLPFTHPRELEAAIDKVTKGWHVDDPEMKTTYPVSVEMLKRGKVVEEHPFQDSCYVIMEDGETGIRWVKRVY